MCHAKRVRAIVICELGDALILCAGLNAGVTQRQMWEAVGVSRATYVRLECGWGGC